MELLQILVAYLISFHGGLCRTIEAEYTLISESKYLVKLVNNRKTTVFRVPMAKLAAARATMESVDLERMQAEAEVTV
jgi:hypothetical protein